MRKYFRHCFRNRAQDEKRREEPFNKEAKQGWRFAADAERITDENAGSEDRKHTSGGVFVTVGQQSGSSF